MGSRILVTGALGAVGQPLVNELRSRRNEVFELDRIHSHHQTFYRCDVSSYRELSRIFEERDFDYVYHLAAEFGRWNGEDFYESMWKSNAIGTKNLIRLQDKHGFRLIFTSSSEVYGDFRGVMAEDVLEKAPIIQMNDYAMSKWVNEMQILNSARASGTETVRLRLFNTYGPGEYYSPYRSAICRFVYSALHGLPYRVYTKHRRTSTYVEDTVRTMANITDRFQPGEVYNIAGAELHDMKSVSDLILAYVGRDDTLVEYEELDASAVLEKRVDISKASKDLGHKLTVDLNRGIPETVDWQRKAYGLA